ncbi:MAG TPA: ABC transporter ATP-binding protein [Gaiellaceae bacterium]|nr:ABC transporter ATP-binding protein [Gaiellaceae bacterium]
MIAFLRHSVAIVVRGWRASPGRMSASFALIALTHLAQPLVPLALARVTDAVVAHDAQTAAYAAAVLPLVAFVTVAGDRVSQVIWVELCDLNLIESIDEIGRLTQGGEGLEHLERADYADRIELLRNAGNPLYRSALTAMDSASLAAQFALTVVLLGRVQPVLLLLLALGVVPLATGRWAFGRIDSARAELAGKLRLGTHLLGLSLRPDAAKEIRVFGLEDELRGRLRANHREVNDRLRRAGIEAVLASAAGQLVFAAGYVAGLLLVVRGAIQGHHSVGDVVLAVTLAAQVNQLVFRAAGTMQFLQLSARAVGRLLWLRDTVAGLYPRRAREAAVPEAIRDGIRVERVSFGYPGTEREVLSEVDLELPAGTTVAFVGENGAGKSTLVKLLCRFYEPTGGRISVDGVDLADLPVGPWRARVAAGFQDFVRFELLARESVGIGDLPAVDDVDAVLAAVDRADARDLVERLPRGLETPLGASAEGVELSGGQWQKVALARAMMRERPLLLILDEPTSALDAHAEHVLFERYAASARAVARATGGIAVFVSHRFSTVRMADLIVVVEGGRIVEQGTHAELVASGGAYAELYALQAAAYA